MTSYELMIFSGRAQVCDRAIGTLTGEGAGYHVGDVVEPRFAIEQLELLAAMLEEARKRSGRAQVCDRAIGTGSHFSIKHVPAYCGRAQVCDRAIGTRSARSHSMRSYVVVEPRFAIEQLELSYTILELREGKVVEPRFAIEQLEL